MKRIVVSAISGESWKPLADFAWPAMQDYAGRVGADFAGLSTSAQWRPASWSKLIAIAWGLSTHEEVLWLDADVDVRRATLDVFAELPPGRSFGLCRLTDERGVGHFNCGVMLCRRGVMPLIVEAAMCDHFSNHPWWEQAAINWLIGRADGDIGLFGLEAKWNAWSGGSCDSPQFRHACGLSGVDAKLAWLGGE